MPEDRLLEMLEIAKHEKNPNLADKIFGNYRRYKNRKIDDLKDYKLILRQVFQPGSTIKFYLDTRTGNLRRQLEDALIAGASKIFKLGGYYFAGKVIFSLFK